MSEQEGCMCKVMVHGSSEAEEQCPEQRLSIAEGLLLFKALTNDLGNNKQPISSLMLLMWKVL